MRATALVLILLLAACSSSTPTPAPQPTGTALQPLGGPPRTPSDIVVRHNNPSPHGIAFQRTGMPLRHVLADAQRSGRPALLLFRTDWCGYCQKLERETLPTAAVRAEAARYTSVSYDAEQPEGRALAERYGVRGFPTLVLVDNAGNMVDRWAGFNEPHIYAAILRQLGTKQ